MSKKKKMLVTKVGLVNNIPTIFCGWASHGPWEELSISHQEDITGRVYEVIQQCLDNGWDIMLRRFGSVEENTLSQVLFIDNGRFCQQDAKCGVYIIKTRGPQALHSNVRRSR